MANAAQFSSALFHCRLLHLLCFKTRALSPTKVNRLFVLPLMVSKKPQHGNLCSSQGRNPAYEGRLFSSPHSPTMTTLQQMSSIEGSILLWGLSNPDFIGVYLELVHI